MSQDYSCTVEAKVSAEEAFKKIARIADWWNQRATGEAEKAGDTFRVDFGETWVDFEVVEAIPNKRVVWRVTDCHLHWLENRTEWKHTRVIWGLSTENGATTISMTHEGLTPQIECFERCEAGWDFHVRKSLLRLLNENAGLPDHGRVLAG